MPAVHCSFGGVISERAPISTQSQRFIFSRLRIPLEHQTLRNPFQAAPSLFQQSVHRWEGLSKVPLVAVGGGGGSSAPKLRLSITIRALRARGKILGLQIFAVFPAKHWRSPAFQSLETLGIFFFFLGLQEWLDYLPLQGIFNRSVSLLGSYKDTGQCPLFYKAFWNEGILQLRQKVNLKGDRKCFIKLGAIFTANCWLLPQKTGT